MSEIMLFNLNLSLFSNTPVVDCELQPKAYLTRSDLSKPPEYFLKCNWYKSKEKVMVTCCVHHCKIATVQCIDCVKYELPVEKSYYCSNKCFIDNWKNHCVRHPAASVGDIKTNIADDQIGSWYCDGSWPSFNSCSAFESGSESSGTATVGEREGESWIEIVSSVTYKPTSHDFGYRLKLESLAVDYEGVPLTLTKVIVTDPVIITPAPSLRRMIPVGSLGCFSNSGLETQPCLAGTFSILTYNVLADYYVNKSSYPYCSRWALTWQYRRQILLHEIIRYNADILCLQEVQRDHFENFFEPELAKLGYAVSYKKKILERYTGEYKSSTDGCATFFRRSRFREIGRWELEFQTIAISAYESLSQHQRTMEAVRLLKDNVALLVILEAVENGAVFCVANTHIHANPNAKDAKLWQVASLINHLESVYASHIPILFCGDLNSLPGSAPHELVVMGRVGSDHEDLANSSVAMFKHVKLSHRMCLASAYSSMLENTNGVLTSKEHRDKMDPKTKEPFFTNLTSQFVGAIDYIFYSEGAFTVTRLLELLDRQSVRKDTALPSPYWPSDHIALMAEFYFEPLDTSWGES